jgi:hypothetical protein
MNDIFVLCLRSTHTDAPTSRGLVGLRCHKTIESDSLEPEMMIPSCFVCAARTLTLPQVGVWLGSVVVMTIGAAFLTQGVRKVPLKFYQLEEGVQG